jgi:N-methylhydantoinase A
VATGVLEITAWNQANALRRVTVQRGLDVRDFVLCSFGGSGSLAVCRLLELLGLPAAVVPRDPGNLSAFGLLTVDVRNDQVQTAVAGHADLEVAGVAATLAALEARAAAALDAEGFPRPAHRCLRSADLRYFGQAFEVRVPVPDGPVDRDLTEATVAAFHDAHHRLYGYSFRDDPSQRVEWVNLRVTGIGPIPRPSLRPLPERASASVPASVPVPAATRPACFDPAWGFVDTVIYRRDDLYPGDAVQGPAVVEEYGATVPLAPGFRAEVDRFGNLVVTRARTGARRRPEPAAP